MERRRFLDCCAVAGMAATFGKQCFGMSPEEAAAAPDDSVAGLLIADPHAHPYQLHGARSFDRTTPTIETLQRLNMALSSFSAVGDMTFMRGRTGMPFGDTRNQLEVLRRLESEGRVAVVRKASDLPRQGVQRRMPCALMAVEGGDALEGRLENLDVFYAHGVRLMTLLHERDNELGFNQRSGADGALTPFGLAVVERMNKLGMLIDVAHAGTATLKGIVSASDTPLIDSHTSPVLPGEDGAVSRRLRTWQEMEMIVRTGGLICTWPLAYAGKQSRRTTLRHWAEEIVLMKARFGIEHCGLGTDGGGGLPRVVDGWESIASLPALIAAMREAGLRQEDIAAFVGGNFLRILAKCLA